MSSQVSVLETSRSAATTEDGESGLGFVPSDCCGDVSLTWMLPSALSFSGVHHPSSTVVPNGHCKLTKSLLRPPLSSSKCISWPVSSGLSGRTEGKCRAHTRQTHHPARPASSAFVFPSLHYANEDLASPANVGHQ